MSQIKAIVLFCLEQPQNFVRFSTSPLAQTDPQIKEASKYKDVAQRSQPSLPGGPVPMHKL